MGTLILKPEDYLDETPGNVLADFLAALHKLDYWQRGFIVEVLKWYYGPQTHHFDWWKHRPASYSGAKDVLADTFEVLGAFNTDMKLIGMELLDDRAAWMRARDNPPKQSPVIKVSPQRLIELCQRWGIDKNVDRRDPEAVENCLLRGCTIAQRALRPKDTDTVVEVPTAADIELLALRIAREHRQRQAKVIV